MFRVAESEQPVLDTYVGAVLGHERLGDPTRPAEGVLALQYFTAYISF
jgi:hypothetical protein